MKRELLPSILVPVIVLALLLVANVTGVVKTAEGRFYDLFLRVQPEVVEDERIVLIDIDDPAIEAIGSWPIGRNVAADALILLRELGTRSIVFDIEYVDTSPRGVNVRVLNQEIPEVFRDELGRVKQTTRDLFSALQSGQISVDDLEFFGPQLLNMTDQAREALLQEVRKVARNNDEYLGQTAAFFGKAFFTVNMQDAPNEEVTDEQRQYVTQNIAIDVEASGPTPFKEASGIQPAIPPILTRGEGAGFPNVFPDPDGVRRRIDLLYEYRDDYVMQLALAPLHDWLGRPEFVMSGQHLVMEGAQLPDGTTKDIRIPLTEEGMMLINWPHKSYEDSFNHVSFHQLWAHDDLLDRLAFNLRAREDWGYPNLPDLISLFESSEQARQAALDDPTDANVANYIESREFFIGQVGAYLESGVEERLLNVVDDQLGSGQLSEAQQQEYERIKEDIPEFYGNTRDIYSRLTEIRSDLRDRLEGAFTIIGHSATGTTDIGVNPFEERYMNVGTHAAVTNTILQGRFLDELPWYYTFAATLLLVIGLAFLVHRLQPVVSIIVGTGAVILIIVAVGVIFVTTGVYTGVLTPAIGLFATFVAITLIKFLQAEQEKGFIRNAFNHYLSAEVINQIMDDPDMLALGGQKKHLTAMFTDVKGFSSISEVLDPGDLVILLNKYLTNMSDVVLQENGTIDKFEGDAIISFFGAPLEQPDNAARACRAALEMKRREMELNPQFLEEKVAPSPLLTRIGLNTGEMVVGNMGTQTRMDYTIMGHHVNLAARLEGVNKQYGTWILASQSTHDEAGELFVWRKLDRVRVVGVTEPVRLFELVQRRDQANKATLELIDGFHEALDTFEQQDFQRAGKLLKELQKDYPEDGPVQAYAKRAEEFIKSPPPANWDGVFNLTKK